VRLGTNGKQTVKFRAALHGFEAAAHDLRGPAIQESDGPDERFVVPDVLKGLLEVPSPGGSQLAGEQRIELATCMTWDAAGSAQQLRSDTTPLQRPGSPTPAPRMPECNHDALAGFGAAGLRRSVHFGFG
jgi:hypothetical protein